MVLTNADAEPLLRKFETEVLDPYHQSRPFWTYPKDQGLWGLMVAYDAMMPVLAMAAAAPGTVSVAQLLKGIQDGFVQAVTWQMLRDGPIGTVPSANWDLINDSGYFIRYAQSYVDIADFHVMYGRGLVGLEAESDPQRIRFVPREDMSHEEEWFGFAQSITGYHKHHRERVNTIQMQMARAAPRVLNLTHRLAEGRVVLEDLSQLKDQEISRMGEAGFLPEAVPLPEHATAKGFTMGEFRRFWSAVVSWSMCCQGLQALHTQRGVPQSECSATQFHCFRDFVSGIAALAEVSEERIRDIVSVLDIGCSTGKPDVMLHPFVLRDEFIGWCPLLVVDSRAERNLLKVLLRNTSTRGLAASLNGEREPLLLRMIGDLLAQKRYQYALRKEVSSDSEKGDIDLLAYSTASPEEVLLVEGKAFLPVDSVNEIDSATKEMQKGQEQLEKVERILMGALPERRKQLYPFVDWGRIKKVYPILVSPDVYPNSDYDYNRIPAITLVAMSALMRSRDFRSPKRIWSAAKERAWLNWSMGDQAISYKRVKVRTVTYEIPYRGDLSGKQALQEWS